MMKRLIEQLPVLALGCALALSACTSDPAASGPDASELASVDSEGSSTTSPDSDSDPDENTNPDDDTDADDTDADDTDAADTDGPDADDNDRDDDPGPTTPQTIVPPGETAPAPTENPGDNEDQGGTSTTTTPVGGVVTTDPSQQPIQEQDTALVCATVEQGYIAVLSGNDDLSGLDDGAQLAIGSGVTDYIDLGEALVSALSADTGVQSAADALLTRCEADGFERLA